jgi:enoyl-CoA hydratase
MRKQLIERLEHCENTPEIRSIVITGAGERAFCAGQDLNDVAELDGDSSRAWIEEWRALYTRVRTLSKPTIGALNGVAAGSGFQFALLLDIRVGHSASRMGQPEINAGIASITGPWIMREILGLSRTTELVLSGRIISGEEAFQYGMLHALVSKEQVFERAMTIAEELSNKAPLAMKLNKNWLREMTQDGFDHAFEHALEAHSISYQSGEPQRTSAKFLSKT